MTERSRPLIGKVVTGKGGAAVTSSDALNALTNIISTARECFETHDEQLTARAKLQAYETTEVRRIKAAQKLLSQYFDQVFAERRAIYQGMFARLDAALDRGDGETIHEILRGIVDIAKESPLAQLGDLSQVRALLDDPDAVWEL
ncbi:hypothetical protein [Aeromicrobium wangtongii]|uniref:Uncharacterized protein n=1 Tax=Aeromicrobium wangtongii TaxID=2969247 RepID=A0ABY5M5M6_9ACTN|nr:hypothetical protein [Aeromicrobium wangtongii]MCD9198334.1 hypothetical protein [Aeromicrobium wangtongii]UUP12366.1 hypothetical protein NQV15_10915 [Aeromicrobium wangtongii]